MDFKPTVLQERIQSLDILRGFSLLGIILVNIVGFNTPQPYIDLGSWFTEASDVIWHQRLDIYVQSSFYPLFSMLFGYGLAMQFMKAERTGVNFYVIGSRRLVTLLIFGLLHAFLLWWGDILITYAFCGVVLLFLLRFKPVFLAIAAVSLNLLYHVFVLFVVGYIFLGSEEMSAISLDIVAVNDAITAYATGSWGEAFLQRVQDVMYQNNPFMLMMSLLTILPYMLIGAAASKWHLVERAKEFKAWWIATGVVFLVIGLFIKSAPFTWNRTYLLDYLKVYIGGPMLSIGYIGIIVSLCFVPQLVKLLRPFARVGRMSITNYLMQSLILSLLFYNFGLGWYGKLDVLTGIVVAIVVFVGQIIFSEIWLSRFRQGPIEAFWRKCTYGKKLS